MVRSLLHPPQRSKHKAAAQSQRNIFAVVATVVLLDRLCFLCFLFPSAAAWRASAASYAIPRRRIRQLIASTYIPPGLGAINEAASIELSILVAGCHAALSVCGGSGY